MKCFIAIVFYLSCIYAAKLPDNIGLCSKSAPDFQECIARNMEDALKKLAQGNKEIGLTTLEPLKVDKMGATIKSRVQIDETYTNIEIYGLTNSRIEKFSLDIDKCVAEIITRSPKIAIYANYTLSGKMMLMSVNGVGRSNQTIENLAIKHNWKCEKYQKKGMEHIRITEYETDFFEYNIHLHYTNLVPGHGQLSDQINKVIYENGNTLFAETKENYQKSYAELFKHLTNNVFAKVPLKEMFLD